MHRSVLLAGALVLASWLSVAVARTDDIKPPAASADSADCLTCHEPAMSMFQHTKHNMVERGCVACHDAAAAAAHLKGQSEGASVPGPSFKGKRAAEVNRVCQGCHDRGNQAHFAGGVHERKGVSCISCHSVHSPASEKAQLKTARDADTCFTCHPGIRAKGLRTSHHPVREGRMECASCHNPHDSQNPKMLGTGWVNDKCLECHTEKRGPFLWEHAPVRENCLNCHDPHGSNHDKLLVAKQPFLCQRCHLNTRHPGTLYDGTNTVGGPSPSNRAVEHACKNCHQNVHGSNAPSGPYLGR
jgi:DmsE family decaheme c-type cytochrome